MFSAVFAVGNLRAPPLLQEAMSAGTEERLHCRAMVSVECFHEGLACRASCLSSAFQKDRAAFWLFARPTKTISST